MPPKGPQTKVETILLWLSLSLSLSLTLTLSLSMSLYLCLYLCLFLCHCLRLRLSLILTPHHTTPTQDAFMQHGAGQTCKEQSPLQSKLGRIVKGFALYKTRLGEAMTLARRGKKATRHGAPSTAPRRCCRCQGCNF